MGARAAVREEQRLLASQRWTRTDLSQIDLVVSEACIDVKGFWRRFRLSLASCGAPVLLPSQKLS